MKKFFRILSIFLSACLLTALGSCERERGYTYWDADESALLDENEWGTAWTETNYFDRWDVDNDGIVDEAEWMTGRTTYMTDYDEGVYGGYEAWDIDNDGRIDENEFRGTVWGYYDRDDDDLWSEEEYDLWWGTVGT